MSMVWSLHHLHLQWQRQTAAQNKHQASVMVKNAFNLECCLLHSRTQPQTHREPHRSQCLTFAFTITDPSPHSEPSSCALKICLHRSTYHCSLEDFFIHLVELKCLLVVQVSRSQGNGQVDSSNVRKDGIFSQSLQGHTGVLGVRRRRNQNSEEYRSTINFQATVLSFTWQNLP